MPPKVDKNDVDESDEVNEKRNALRDRKSIWRRRVVPYIFDGSLSKFTILDEVNLHGQGLEQGLRKGEHFVNVKQLQSRRRHYSTVLRLILINFALQELFC